MKEVESFELGNVLAQEAWAVYGSGYRSNKERKEIRDFIGSLKAQGIGNPEAPQLTISPDYVKYGSLRMPCRFVLL